MPKIVDHDAQRRLIAEAAVEWIATNGLDTLSQRNVAALSGRSKGNVQHYFPDKQALMFGALRRVSEHRTERLIAGFGTSVDDDPFAALRQVLLSVLPLDRERADEWRVRLSLYVYADRDAAMQEYLAGHAKDVLDRGTDQIRAAQAAGQVRADLDPELTYRRLQASVSGIAVAALANGGALDAETQQAMLTEVFRSITTKA